MIYKISKKLLSVVKSILRKRLLTLLVMGIILVSLLLGFYVPRIMKPLYGEPFSIDIPSGAQLISVGIGVYNDVTCTEVTTYVDWGTLTPGESKSIFLYLRNEGNSDIDATITSSNWNPETAGNFLILSWDFGTIPLKADRIRKVTFSLFVDPSITGITEFSFIITITANSV